MDDFFFKRTTSERLPLVSRLAKIEVQCEPSAK